jgi:hypothetical protein
MFDINVIFLPPSRICGAIFHQTAITKPEIVASKIRGPRLQDPGKHASLTIKNSLLLGNSKPLWSQKIQSAKTKRVEPSKTEPKTKLNQ